MNGKAASAASSAGRGFALAYRLASAFVYSMLICGVVWYLELLVTREFHAAVLPIAGVLGLGLAWWRPVPHCDTTMQPADPRRRRIVTAIAALVILSIAIALAYGAIATPARHWDGAISWDLKARYLSVAPTLDQPYFDSYGVYVHTPDYPLLQPLWIAAGNRIFGDGLGRALLPIGYLALVLWVGAVCALSTQRAWLGLIAAVGVGVVPALVNPTMGAVDSGFADSLFALWIAVVVGAMALRDRALLFAAIACCVFGKPEGLVFGALAIGVLWARRERDLLTSAVGGFALAAVLWLPLQQILLHRDGAATVSPLLLWLAILAIALVVLGSDRVLRVRPLLRCAIVLASAPLLALALPLLLSSLGTGVGTFDGYLADLGRPLRRLAELPTILGHALARTVDDFRFGSTYLLLLLSLIAAWRYRGLGCRLGSAGWFTLCGLAGITAAFLLSPETDLVHHVKSSMSRLLLHWIGAAWIISIVQLADVAHRLRRAVEPTPPPTPTLATSEIH